MIDAPEKNAVISGLGMSRIGRRLDATALELTRDAAMQAIADAGLTAADIDGIATLGDTPLEEAAAELGITPQFTGGGLETGGLLAPVMSAGRAVGTGRARHVLVYRTVQMMGGTLQPGPKKKDPDPTSSPARAALNVMGDMGPLLAHHAYSAANWLAMHAQLHMHRYGTTKEQLGWLAVQSRRHAAGNPAAVFRDPITMDDYLAARPISSPFGLLDCDVPVDGSIALVVSTAAHAEGCPRPPVRIEAMGGSTGLGAWTDRPDYPRMASWDAATEMWGRTDLRPADVDLAQLYDGFTYLTLAWLEALGFCKEGESGPFVDGGARIGLQGELPLNTYGGQLSAGRMHGYWVLHEACLQLRHEAGARQVPNEPQVGVVSAGGGPIAGCLLLTR